MKICLKGTKVFLKMLLILILATVVGYLALVIAYKIPVNAASKAETYQYMEYMGWDPAVNNRYSRYESSFDTFEPAILNDSTDKVILQKAYAEEEGSPFINALYMQGYGRYWQGYVAVLRPIFKLMNYWDFHLINSLLQLFLVFCLCFLIQKETGKFRYTCACISSYFLLMPVAVALSLQYTPVFYMAYLSSIGVLLLKDRLKPSHIIFYFLLVGILTNYFDFLTYPLLSWAFPLCWYFVIHPKYSNIKDRFLMVVTSSIGWVFGYVGMYFTKWTLLFFICGREMFDTCAVFHAFDYVGEIPADLFVTKETYYRFDILFTNWRHYLFSGSVCILVLWILWGLYHVFKNQGKLNSNSLIWLLITLSSPAWFLVFTSHTMLHHVFTYRIYGASILAFLLLLCENATQSDRPSFKLSVLVKKGVILAMAFLIGFLTTHIARENVTALYGGDFQEVTLAPGQTLTGTFLPTFSRVRQFALMGKTSEGTDGNILVTISDEATNYTLTYDKDWFDTKACNPIAVDWKFTPLKPYQFTVETTKPEGTTLYLSMPGVVPLNEFRETTLDTVPLGETQPLGLIVYNTTVRSRLVRLYLSLLVATYLFFIYCSACSIKSEKDA